MAVFLWLSGVLCLTLSLSHSLTSSLFASLFVAVFWSVFRFSLLLVACSCFICMFSPVLCHHSSHNSSVSLFSLPMITLFLCVCFPCIAFLFQPLYAVSTSSSLGILVSPYYRCQLFLFCVWPRSFFLLAIFRTPFVLTSEITHPLFLALSQYAIAMYGRSCLCIFPVFCVCSAVLSVPFSFSLCLSFSLSSQLAADPEAQSRLQEGKPLWLYTRVVSTKHSTCVACLHNGDTYNLWSEWRERTLCVSVLVFHENVGMCACPDK